MNLPIKVRFEYEETVSGSLNYTHGVWGGINPQGEIEMNFYQEKDKIPPFSERSLSPEGVLGPELIPFEDDTRTVVRSIHSKILVNFQTAKALHDWLAEKIEAMEEENSEYALEEDESNREQ